MTRVIVVDDAPLFQAGIAAALENAGFEVVGQAEDAMRAVAESKRLQPDVVVLDVLMPGLSGLDVVDKIVEAVPHTKVVLLTASESEEDLLSAIKSGASGYVVKETPLPQLVAAIKDVVKGGAVISPMMASKLFRNVRQLLRHRDIIAGRRPTLTGREVEVLQLVAQGMTSREIGEKLFISENTVKNHVRNILGKLHLNRKQELIRYALEHGIE